MLLGVSQQSPRFCLSYFLFKNKNAMQNTYICSSTAKEHILYLMVYMF